MLDIKRLFGVVVARLRARPTRRELATLGVAAAGVAVLAAVVFAGLPWVSGELMRQDREQSGARAAEALAQCLVDLEAARATETLAVQTVAKYEGLTNYLDDQLHDLDTHVSVSMDMEPWCNFEPGTSTYENSFVEYKLTSHSASLQDLVATAGPAIEELQEAGSKLLDVDTLGQFRQAQVDLAAAVTMADDVVASAAFSTVDAGLAEELLAALDEAHTIMDNTESVSGDQAVLDATTAWESATARLTAALEAVGISAGSPDSAADSAAATPSATPSA